MTLGATARSSAMPRWTPRVSAPRARDDEGLRVLLARRAHRRPHSRGRWASTTRRATVTGTSSRFAKYLLLDANKKLAVNSQKVGFCIAPTDGVDLVMPGAAWQPTSSASAASAVPRALGSRGDADRLGRHARPVQRPGRRSTSPTLPTASTTSRSSPTRRGAPHELTQATTSPTGRSSSAARPAPARPDPAARHRPGQITLEHTWRGPPERIELLRRRESSEPQQNAVHLIVRIVCRTPTIGSIAASTARPHPRPARRSAKPLWPAAAKVLLQPPATLDAPISTEVTRS